MKFLVSQTGNEFSFVLTDDAGNKIGTSATNFENLDSCIASIRSTISLLPLRESYQLEGTSYSIVSEGNTILKSVDFATADEAKEAYEAVQDDASDEAQYTVEVITQVETTQSRFVELPTLSAIDYASLYDFNLQSVSNTAGIELIEPNTNQYSFLVNGSDGNPIIYTRHYDSISKREKRIRQVIKAAEREDKFEIIEENGGFYFILKAKNNAEIARSKTFMSKEAANEAIAYCIALLPTFEAQYPEPTKKKRKSNSYDFSITANSDEAGFHSIRNENKDHFFLFNDTNGSPLFYSQGYTGRSGRDNGIVTVIKNCGLTDQHEVKEIEGKYYFILRSANRQEIARSIGFDTAESATAKLQSTLTEVRSFASKYGVMIDSVSTETHTDSFVINVDLPKETEEPAAEITESNRNEDEYLDCDTYKGHTDSPAEGFKIFEIDGSHFFVVENHDGDVLLRSESYPTTGARDNGVASVQKNREIKERYAIIEDTGNYFVTLKAGNHKEIARSCPFDSEENAYNKFAFLKDTSAQFPWLAPVALADEAATANREEDNYLACKEYANHSEVPHRGFYTFTKEDSGQHYFAMFDERDEKILLRSEGYPTKSARDNGIESVLKNREIKERYSIIESDSGHYFVVLKAANHKEIARSCGSRDKAGLWALFPFLGDSAGSHFPWEIAGIGAAAIAAPLIDLPEIEHSSIAPNTSIEVEPTAEAEIPAIENPVNQAETEETIGTITETIPLVTPPVSPDDTAVEQVEKESKGIGTGVLGAGAAAAAFGAKALNETIKETKKDILSTPSKPKAISTTESETKGGIPRWLWALLAALLLACLLWWLLKGCDDKNIASSADVTPPSITSSDTSKTMGNIPPASVVGTDSSNAIASADSVKKIITEKSPEQQVTEPTETPVAAATITDCGCDNGKNSVFMRYAYEPKVLKKLGSNTEFGNSHGLSPQQFYDKLNAAYATNEVDKTFLDNLYKTMGYKNGWADAKPSQFSATTIPYGTVGNIGYSKQHRTQYSILNLNEHDQKAFKIIAENGCNVHFMKTCGNHLFFCSK